MTWPFLAQRPKPHFRFVGMRDGKFERVEADWLGATDKWFDARGPQTIGDWIRAGLKVQRWSAKQP